MAHALLSPSGAEKWLNCTPSVRLEEQFPETSSEYAAEGTLAHSLAEAYNTYMFNMTGEDEHGKRLAEIENNPLYNRDMHNYILDFYMFVTEEYEEIKVRTGDAFIAFEQSLDLSEYAPDSFGTGDVVIIGDGLIHIIDLKYGKGVMVDAEDNKQMMLYALGAYSAFNMLYAVDTIKMTIYQPRLDNISTTEISVAELLTWANGELKEKAALAFDGAGEFNPGDHCRFCKAKAVCRARAEQNLKLQSYEYKHPDLLTDDEISDIIIISERLKSWADDIAAYALTEALSGKKWRGFKLVEGRSNRKYSDENAVQQILLNKNYGLEQFTKTSLFGITDMEKLLTKKQFNALLSEYIIKPPGKPALVPETDKRPEYSSAAIDFADVDFADIPA